MPDVPELVRTLRQEHAAMDDILGELERQLARIADGQPVETEVIARILDYCLAYPAQLHHRKEDLLIARLRTRDAAAAAVASDLDTEHAYLVGLTARFTATAKTLVGQPGGSNEEFAGAAGAFVRSYRSHIDSEERYLFPAAIWSLSSRDWVEIHREAKDLEPKDAGTRGAR